MEFSGPILEVKGLSVEYITPTGSIKALSSIDLELQQNEILGIAGESGSGKSTLANAILGILRPPAVITSGEIKYKGRLISAFRSEEIRHLRWKEISYIPQGSMNSLNPVLRIRDQFVDVISEHAPSMNKREVIEMASDLLKRVNLNAEEVLRAYPHELSGGMKQRVIIAMALALKPSLVIADEPTTALDVVTQKEIIQMLKELRKDFGFSMIFISHDISILAEICDSILVIYAGKNMEWAPMGELLSSPKHPYSMALINNIPKFSSTSLTPLPGEPADLADPPKGCVFHPRCKYAMPICSNVEPRKAQLGEKHYAWCHLYG
ncbi:MAG: ABC transporter ATP-binding protein [Thermoprotei archaeon]